MDPTKIGEGNIGVPVDTNLTLDLLGDRLEDSLVECTDHQFSSHPKVQVEKMIQMRTNAQPDNVPGNQEGGEAEAQTRVSFNHKTTKWFSLSAHVPSSNAKKQGGGHAKRIVQ